MPPGNHMWNRFSLVVLSSGKSAVMRGLQAASTDPFEMPKIRLPAKRLQKFQANMVRSIPTRCPTKAKPTMRPMPIRSQNGPPKSIASVKPHRAAPSTWPSCSWLRWNCTAQAAPAPPRMAKLIAVTMRATWLPRKSRLALIMASGLEAECLEVGDARGDVADGVGGLVLDEEVLHSRLLALLDDRRP